MPAGPASGLDPGGRLVAGQGLVSANRDYQLIMQPDGNLVLYQSGRALWSSETSGHPGAFAVMQEDGNLVVYDGATALWNSGTWGFPKASLVLQDDSNLVIYQQGHPVWDWPVGYLGDQLNQWKLEPGAYLLSRRHEYKLAMQPDGNLVLYRGGSALWASGTAGDVGAYAVMQGDGNFVIYKEGVAEWNSNTNGFPGAYLQLQDDSNAVIYQAGHPVWDWGSGYIGNQLNGWRLEPGAYLLSADHTYELIMQGDGNLVLYHGGSALWSSGTNGSPGGVAVMQPDGNFVVYSGGVARWNSNTAGYPGSYLVLQNDSNVVIFQGATALWDWGSGKLVGGGGAPGVGERILDEAAKWGGRPYCFAGGGPAGPSLGTTDPENGLRCGTPGYNPAGVAGFDCTGLTLYAVYQVTGKVLAHSFAQATNAVAQGGQRIYNQSELQPGDLVYFGPSFGNIVHTGVYAGGVNGKPSFWSAVTEGIGVALEPMAWETSAEPFVGGVRF
ncbi:MAG TPA: NlpC/P60 family protein [Solirubrobacterales bacterium]